MDAGINTNHGTERVSDLPGLCRSVFEDSPKPMAMVAGAKHLVRYVNSAFCRLVGKSNNELTGRPCIEIVQVEGCLSFLDHVYRTGEAANHTEHCEAKTAYWSYAMWPVLGADERLVGVMIQVTETEHFQAQATAMNQELLLSAVRQHELMEVAEKLNAQLQREIAERKRMENALLNSEKLSAMARLASTMAHEINNPLGAITNLIYLLTPLQITPAAQAYVATLDDQVRGLTRIATQMLKFHRESNRQPSDFLLAEVIGEVVDFYRPQAEHEGVLVTRRIETEGRIMGYRGEILQVVTNLLLNSLEATSAGGEVTIHLYAAPPWLCKLRGRSGYCLAVADTGCGIDPQYRARIFEPFFTTKGDKGTGLGLWLCTGIVNRVRGSIRAWSMRTANRSGTCLAVFLPAEEISFTPLRRRYER